MTRPSSPGQPQCPGRLRAGLTALLLLTIALGMPSARADNLRLAYQLLKVTGVEDEFQKAADLQTADIVRTYALIFQDSTDTDLPESIKQEISLCYQRVYAWDNFEAGIATIFAENMSQSDLRILIDFFSDLSVPPPQIPQFKELIGRAHVIEQRALNYMFDQSEGCDARNVGVIRSYLGNL
jgi:hypothetical protein